MSQNNMGASADSWARVRLISEEKGLVSAASRGSVLADLSWVARRQANRRRVLRLADAVGSGALALVDARAAAARVGS